MKTILVVANETLGGASLFDTVPTVVGGPYEYGVPGAVHGVFKAPEPAATPSGAGSQPAGGSA
jgi:cytochrome c oxidase subunit 1